MAAPREAEQEVLDVLGGACSARRTDKHVPVSKRLEELACPVNGALASPLMDLAALQLDTPTAAASAGETQKQKRRAPSKRLEALASPVYQPSWASPRSPCDADVWSPPSAKARRQCSVSTAASAASTAASTPRPPPCPDALRLEMLADPVSRSRPRAAEARDTSCQGASPLLNALLPLLPQLAPEVGPIDRRHAAENVTAPWKRAAARRRSREPQVSETPEPREFSASRRYDLSSTGPIAARHRKEIQRI
eukprot:TRINITY_DN17636_c0_g2_i2.p1 TRINITY_DN17636_c0_g2~~TRINITY_DN17636_c0_g2_i2.p1  ORF type:complete len:251 (+),score=31.71 TRINITY_DN17636_c0_g2_i2:242-994(+)